jgi:anti-sigma B factor antagonist
MTSDSAEQRVVTDDPARARTPPSPQAEIDAAPPFAVSSRATSGGNYLVRVQGEVDLHVSMHVAAELERLEDDGADGIVVDLSEVPFLDSSGIGVLLAAGKRLGRSRLTVVAPGMPVRRALELTGADRVLHVVGEQTEG